MSVVHMNYMRVQKALRLARQLQLKSGQDAEAFSTLRRIFTDDLLQSGSSEVFSATLSCIPTGNSAQDWVRLAHAQAGAVFEHAGRLLVAIACPVTLCVRGPASALEPFDQGDAAELSFLEDRTQEVMRARRVAFGRQMFTLQDLMERTPRQTLAHCRELLEHSPGRSVRRGAGDPVPWSVRSSPSAKWELTFFLGVCELDRLQSLQLELAAPARNLHNFSVHGTYAILSTPQIKFNRNLWTDGTSHGVLLQTRAIPRGEQALLVHQLHDFLASLEEGSLGFSLKCFEETVGSVYRMLVNTGVMAQEIVWQSRAETSRQLFSEAVLKAAALLGDQRDLRWASDRTSYLADLHRCGISIPG